jgi:hypothetical protein
MNCVTQNLTLMEHVEETDPKATSFTLRCSSGQVFRTHVGPNTEFRVLRSIDNLNRDRLAAKGLDDSTASERLDWCVTKGRLIAVQGVQISWEGGDRFQAVVVHLLHSREAPHVFEDTRWWLSQIARMADEWLENLFDSRRSYRLDDFAKLYRTNLNIYGQATDDTTQECATLSRLIYGLSSAFFLVDGSRALLPGGQGRSGLPTAVVSIAEP